MLSIPTTWRHNAVTIYKIEIMTTPHPRSKQTHEQRMNEWMIVRPASCHYWSVLLVISSITNCRCYPSLEYLLMPLCILLQLACLNDKKTEVMWLGSRQRLNKLSVQQVKDQMQRFLFVEVNFSTSVFNINKSIWVLRKITKITNLLKKTF